MMLVCNLSDIKYNYEFEKLVRLFLPFERIDVVNELKEQENYCLLSEEISGENAFLTAKLFIGDKIALKTDSIILSDPNYKKECERKLSVCLYNCFSQLTGYNPPWGILTGVRPARLFSRTVSTKGIEDAKSYFSNELLVSDERISLCEITMQSEEAIIEKSTENSFSLYIGIPFCPSRCSYCSFVSHSVKQAGELIPQYLKYLKEEIINTAQIVKDIGLSLKTVYVGGGTPTTLDANQLKDLLSLVRDNFDLSDLSEFTVEAGRPDTITKEKLLALKNSGVTRISINPQTMSDQVLNIIGRRHTALDTVKAFNLARECGFDNINMDLIAGLPGDSFEGFKSTVGQILSLNPESVTVHTLSMKRASGLNASGTFPEIEQGKIAFKMVSYAREELQKAGLPPYYMYRQSKTLGNLENVGYAKKGYECLYNVYIMDETHTIMACGASAVTKLRQPGGDDIKRIFNFKYPYEYIGRYSEQSKRKKGVYDFYKEYPIK